MEAAWPLKWGSLDQNAIARQNTPALRLESEEHFNKVNNFIEVSKTHSDVVLLEALKINNQILQIEHKRLRIQTGERLTSWLFTQRGRGVELGTTENKSR